MERQGSLDFIELVLFLKRQSRQKPRRANAFGGGKLFPLTINRQPVCPAVLEDGIIPDKDVVIEVDLNQGKETVVLNKVA